MEENLTLYKKLLDLELNLLSNTLTLIGDKIRIKRGLKILTLLQQYSHSNTINTPFIYFVVEMFDTYRIDKLDEYLQPIGVTAKGNPIVCKTYGQVLYVNAIKNNSIIFGIGPAATGKTYLAIALAVIAYKSKQVEKIILTHPDVETSGKFGFLSGNLSVKADPGIRPIYETLQELLGLEVSQTLLEKDIIEVVPLSCLRGRTLSNAFIVLDDAQNTTREQMKMFLTRMGEGSKIVVSGDITQIDLPNDKISGLLQVTKILQGKNDIEIVKMRSKDVVRNKLVQTIVEAYEKNSEI